MDSTRRIGSGIDGLDRAIDGLRSGDTVLWQVEHIRDYMFAATRFVTSTARGGQRIVYLRFGEHDEVIDAQALAERGANVKSTRWTPPSALRPSPYRCTASSPRRGRACFISLTASPSCRSTGFRT